MHQPNIIKLKVNWAVVGIILIGIYFSLGWFAHGYAIDYQAKKAELHKAEVGIGGAPAEDEIEKIEGESEGEGMDMLCIPLEGEVEEKKLLQEI